MRTALQITVDGDVNVLDLDSAEGSLKVMQNAVGGWIECVSLTTDTDMYVNEEGKLTGLALNQIATKLWSIRYGVGTGTIEGDVILTGGVDSEGGTRGLTPANQKLFEKLANGFERW